MITTKKMAPSFSQTANSRSDGQESQPLMNKLVLKLQGKWTEIKCIFTLLVFTVFLSLVVYHWAPLQLPHISSFPAFTPLIAAKQESNNIDTVESEDTRILARILKEASMEENKTVIVTLMNQAWAEPNSTFDLFIEGFRIGQGTERLLRHVVVVCLDDKAYSRCLEVFPRRCFLLKTSGVDFSGEKKFMLGDYLAMMWRRTEFLSSLLELGYNFLFTDLDTIWLRDPFPRLVADVDFQIACDFFFNGNFSDRRNQANGGFKFVNANRRTIEFYKYWYESRLRFPGKNEQEVLNWIKNDQYVNKIGLTVRFLDTTDVGNFCQPNWDITKVCVMHGNCCIGQDNKLRDLRQLLEDWTVFSSNNADRKRGFRQPKNCRRSFMRRFHIKTG